MVSFISEVSEQEIRREKERAKVLRKSRWWSIKLARGICYYCGCPFPSRELTMDHVVPIIRGGKSVPSNIVAACKECNSKKKYLLPVEWDEYLEHLKRDSGE